MSRTTLGRSHAIHAISQYFKCEYTSSEFRFILCLCALTRAYNDLGFECLIVSPDCVIEPFMLWDSFLRESLIHSLKKELVKPTIIHFFFLALKRGVGEKTHHTIATFLRQAFMSFLLFSTHCEFLPKETMLRSPVFLCQCSGWQAASRSHWETFDIVEVFYARKKITPCAFPWTALHMWELTEVPKVGRHT